MMIPTGTAVVLLGVLVGALSKRWGFRPFMLMGAAAALIGSLGLAFTQTELWLVVISSAFVGMGMMLYAAMPGLLMQVAPAADRGVTSGTSGALFVLTISAAIPITGVVMQSSATMVDGITVYSRVASNQASQLPAFSSCSLSHVGKTRFIRIEVTGNCELRVEA